MPYSIRVRPFGKGKPHPSSDPATQGSDFVRKYMGKRKRGRKDLAAAPSFGAERQRNACKKICPLPFENLKEEEEPMAIAAYIFIETMQGKAKTISRQIGEIPGVKTAHTVTGPYDVITYVEADSLLVLGDFIVSKIQAIPGVLRTLTNVIIDG